MKLQQTGNRITKLLKKLNRNTQAAGQQPERNAGLHAIPQ
jgi:hypothetical protein